MSDTNSKGGKKDTDKIQFIKVGSESFSQIFTKKNKGDARKEPSDFHTRIEPQIPDPEAPATPHFLENTETGLSAEMQIERLATEAPLKISPDEIGEIPFQEPSVPLQEMPRTIPEPLSTPTTPPILKSDSSDQVELMKRYVSLKETEIKDLRDQQKQYQAFIKKVSSQLETLTMQNREYLNELESTKQREAVIKREFDKLKEKHEQELSLLRSNYEEKLEKMGNVKNQASELEHRQEAWQEKVKEDLKRIKLKEKELENKYELLKRDTQALIDSKDKHVLELKKKNDALDLELESFEDKLRRANAVLASVESKKNKVLDTLRLITGLIEALDTQGVEDNNERKAG